MRPQDGFNSHRVWSGVRLAPAAGTHLIGDPGGLGALLELPDVLLAPPRLHRHDCDEPPAGNEAHEQQPPLEFRHVAGRIGRVAERTLARE
jgi:hypothetical protein